MSSKTKALLILLSTFVLGVVVGSLATGVLHSQRERSFERMLPRQRFHAFVERVVQPSPEQKAEFESIMTRWSERLSELHHQHQSQMFTMYDSLHAELQSLLTDEQRARLEEHLARGGERLVERRLAGLASALNLNAEQEEAVRQILEDGPRLQRHGPRRDWEQHRRMMREHFRETEQQIEEILTPEQRERFRDIKHEFGPPFERPFPGPRKHRPPRRLQQ